MRSRYGAPRLALARGAVFVAFLAASGAVAGHLARLRGRRRGGGSLYLRNRLLERRVPGAASAVRPPAWVPPTNVVQLRPALPRRALVRPRPRMKASNAATTTRLRLATTVRKGRAFLARFPVSQANRDTRASLISVRWSPASYATGINNSGEVVGYEKANGSYYTIPEPDAHAFRWSEAQGKTYLPDSSAYTYFTGINDSGVATGMLADASTGSASALLYDSNQDSESVAAGSASRAFAINVHGIATGGWYFPDHQSMFRWNGQSVEELPLDPHVGGWAVGYGIDANGTVVGYQGEFRLWRICRRGDSVHGWQGYRGLERPVTFRRALVAHIRRVHRRWDDPGIWCPRRTIPSCL